MKRGTRSFDSEDETPSKTLSHTKRRRLIRRSCLVCDKEKGSNQFPSSSRVSSHDHDPSVCRACYIEHVESEIDNKPWDQVACPQCSELLSYAEVKSMTTAFHFQKYDMASLRAAISDDADFRYCMSPACESGQLHHGGTDEPIFRCQACSSKHCVACEVPWHEAESCRDFQKRRELEQLRENQNERSEQKMNETTKPCPNCRARIEKNNGCDHMTCSKCRHEFCWLCFADYRHIFRSGNYLHDEYCRYHRPPPVQHPTQYDDDEEEVYDEGEDDLE